MASTIAVIAYPDQRTAAEAASALQEMQRESNTILSKTTHLEITRAGVAIKADIEKLREQVQNVE